MRNLSAAALLKVANNIGSEPINIIEVEWVKGSDLKISYADRDLTSIDGKILELANLDNVINITGNSDSQEITVKLDDTNGNIRAIMDVNDIHFRDVWVYQWFEGLDLSDKFLLFKGKINSPVTWNEGDRTVSFTIISQLESREIGFSPEEGNFPDITPELIGKPWPMCFGTVKHVRALRITETMTGILGDGIGIADFALPARAFALSIVAGYRGLTTSTHINQSDATLATYLCQEKTQRNSFRVFNHDQFPRGTINLEIGKATLEGHFVGSTNRFVLHNIGDNYKLNHPEWPNFEVLTYAAIARGWGTGSATSGGGVIQPCPGGETFTAPGYGGLITTSFEYRCGGDCTQKSKYFPHAEGWLPFMRPLRADKGFWPTHYTGKVIGDNAGYIFLNAGNKVQLATDEKQKFVVSIVPGTVLHVTAWSQREGQRFLQTVPQNYYTVSTESWGDITAVIVTLNEALSKYEDMGWEDDIFVTFRSDIGPNVVNILEYLIDLYTDFTVDSTSFDHVRGRIEVYSAHFAIYDRKDILTVLQEISYQACCSLILKNDVFHIKYLPEEPTTVSTIGKGDILVDSLMLEHTNTEDIITKMVCKWSASGAQEEPYTTILRHNVAKYGTHLEDFDYYIYNYVDAIIKSATFWIIRRSNTWKKLTFNTPLTKLNLESLDSIDINLIGDLANVSVISTIETVAYNSDDRSLHFTCWTPVKAGTMIPYIFAYPADVDETLTFPTPEEIQQGFNGSGFSPNKSATGQLVPGRILANKSYIAGSSSSRDAPCSKFDTQIQLAFKDCKDKDEDDDDSTEEEKGDLINDEGKRHPSDLGDEQRSPDVPLDETWIDDPQGPPSVDYEGVSLPSPDGWGNDYGSGPGSGLEAGDTDSDDTDGLPDPDDIDDDVCNVTVYVGQLAPVTHVRPGTCTNSAFAEGYNVDGTFGCVVNGNYVANASIYVFNSREMAIAKVDQINANKFGTVGENLEWSAYLIGGTCPEPDDPQMIAFRGP